MTPETTRQLNFLASLPSGNTTMSRRELKEMLLETGGMVMARGELYDIATKHLGAGVYRVSLKARP